MSPHETPPRRHHSVIGKPLRDCPADGIHTLVDLLNYSVDRYSQSNATGSRQNLGTTVVETPSKDANQKRKPWTMFTRGPYEFHTYVELKRKVRAIGSGLRQLGMQSGENFYIYGATSENWLTCAHAASSQSMTFVTAYESLGVEGLTASLQATKPRSAFVDENLLPTLSKAILSHGAFDLKFVIVNTTGASSNTNVLYEFGRQHPHILLLTFDQLYRLGQICPHEPNPPRPDDPCAIFYTSGSTGGPKGVPVTQKAVVAAVSGLDSIIGQHLSPKDTFLAFLPLAHVLEFAFENACLFWGVTIGYGSPRTLFDASMHQCQGDLLAFQPSFMIGAPAIWEKIKSAIHLDIANSSDQHQESFNRLLLQRRASMMSKYSGSSENRLEADVLPEAQHVVGKNLRFAMTGGAPIAASTQEMISAAVAPLINGYGLTETMAMGGLMNPAEWSPDYLGSIPASIEMKLVDHLDLGYSTRREPPQGQIYIRGASCFSGYLSGPDNNADGPLTVDGWFATGDIGEWVGETHFKIIDRAKNLVKCLNGEYIAIEKLESIYRSASLISNLCIHASPLRSKPVAIIIPDPAAFSYQRVQSALITSLSTPPSTPPRAEIPKRDDWAPIRLALMQEIRQIWSEAHLSGMEMLEGIVIAEETEWTPQNGMATSVGKLNRKFIARKYARDIDALLGI
ncbi:long-chain fatty acid-CoA ligase [Ciborinia camelliae]|nr:long-chain fatty acid-CoA ligase [Ciborinia camelliae]